MVKGSTDMDEPTESPTLDGQQRRAVENKRVLEYLDLAESLAARFASRGRERDDLTQVAYLGLVKAARGFDESRGTSFPGYAAPTITGELKRYLRDRCWVVRPPRRVQDLRGELVREGPALAQSLGRSPTPTELARRLGVPVSEIGEASAAATSMQPDSLDAADQHSEGHAAGDRLAAQDPAFERLDELICLTQAVSELCAQDRELLYRRYFCEESQTDLGKRFGVSQMQISRRLSRVLVCLQQRLSAREIQKSPSSRTASSTS
jgi:RNA polymerase sigma-B factor